MKLVASFTIDRVVSAPLGLLWQSVGGAAGVSRREFDAYFAGIETGIAIHISNVVELHRPISLDELRVAWKGFQPPQGFRYLSQFEVARLMGGASDRRAA
jgi:predicted transcriptional regulator